MARTTVKKQFTKAFEVGPDFFIRLRDLASAHEIELSAKVKLSDDSHIDDLKICELVELPNLKSRQIQQIEASSAWKSPVKIEVSFSSNEFRNVRYEVSGSDKDAIYFASEIDRLVRDGFSWHSFASAMPPFVKGAIWAAINCAAIILFFAWYKFDISWGSIAGAGCSTSPWLYQGIMKRMFPIAIFSIGDGAARATKLAGVRKTIASFLLVAIVTGIGVNLASNKLWEAWPSKSLTQMDGPPQ